MRITTTFFLLIVIACSVVGENNQREHLLMDQNWKFGFGHPYDVKEDYMHATGYFSYITKAGYGDGPAAADFDDVSWRLLNLPHDWAVEQPFNSMASHSHGYKAVGRKFPDTSVAWYRKSIVIPESDLGKRISIQFDGIHRNSKIWINGFYLGAESSGYNDIHYDITPYLNYGGENVIAVRVDVTIEEGWFYEGAGIYRHAWLNKTAPLHIAYNGTFVTSEVDDQQSEVKVETTIVNEKSEGSIFNVIQTIVDSKGKKVAFQENKEIRINPAETKEITSLIDVNSPTLWSIEEPYLYTLVTAIQEDGVEIDSYETKFGIRSIKFDSDLGFFLNGKSVKIKGTCNHQDHAGVGTAIPDALQDFRIKRLKSMGSNAYRCSHNPPTPELLEACDRLGMLVMCENRLMGTSPEIYHQLKRMIVRDRNHPSVILWSLGNEEWAIETNVKGSRISAEMQTFARQFDHSRPFTVASSGGWGHGSDIGVDVIGYNYIGHGNIDDHHKNFPNQPGIGSEEATSRGTRGVWKDDLENGHMAPTDRTGSDGSIEFGWKFYAEREFLSGLFFWTGFDYRGESNPLDFPAISSQFGIMDVCGFPKDTYHYLKAQWTNDPYLHLSPHWNWEGREGEEIAVWAQTNCDEVELFLNGNSLGRKAREPYSHVEWIVPFEPGSIVAKGYQKGEQLITEKVETTGKSAAIELIADRSTIYANGEDVSVITVQINDDEGRYMPIANSEITFSIDGPGKIIGVGNGDPASHEADKVFEEVEQIRIKNTRIAQVRSQKNQPEITPDFDDSEWPLHVFNRQQLVFAEGETVVVRGEFDLDKFSEDTRITLYSKSLANNQNIYINGELVASNIEREEPVQVFELDHKILKDGKNCYAIVGAAFQKRSEWEELNTDAGLIQIITPEPIWKRSAFNGLAQIIVQSTKQLGEITLLATSPNLKGAELNIKTIEGKIRPAVE
jgi:beta-galactosidase